MAMKGVHARLGLALLLGAALAVSPADAPATTEKNVVTPGPIVPAREMLGDLLLEVNRPADALREFEASMAKEPNRFGSTAGAVVGGR